MIELLATPVEVDTPYGLMSATHQAWGHTHQPWNRSVYSYRVLGMLVDGKFKPFPGTEEYINIIEADFDALMDGNAQGKQPNVFRTTDVIAKHREVRDRPLTKKKNENALSNKA